ncbi:MAG: VCBS repeat-containing protein, partial [Mameliella sp.]|nr:VCBS repeat-containing protein [Phaeodactylibacter sp.]
SMGVDIADLNNDQLPDIFSTDMLPFDEEIYQKSGGEDTDQLKKIKSDLGFEEQYARNHLQLNSGHGYFTDLALQTRTFATDWSWGVLMQDFDNNGRKDIFISNGIVKRPNDLDYINYLNSEAISKLDEDDPERTRKLIEKLPSEPLHNILFLQGDEMRFSSLEESKVGPPTFSNGVAYADLDKDGTLEVIVNNINATAHILTLGEKDKTGSFLNIKLKDDKQNTVLGTKVYVYTKNQDHYQELQVVKGYQSSSSYTLHFGLGAVSQVDSVRIIWPDLSQQLLSGVSANKELEVVKPSEKTDQVQSAAIAIPAFEVFSLLHEENAYEDFDQEKLMPSMLSREGPTVLFEDLNEDGVKDLLIGGAHGFPMRLLKGKSNGAFENLQIEDFIRDAQYEDADFATIDFDKDGDLDLYAVSGGGAAKELDKALEDRLYLNNGNMDFRRVPLSLPHTNGSVAAVADFNNDGYEDIFVGARSIPGSYGLSPYSFVLTNKSGQGVDIAYKHRFGMVSDAQWADIDHDNDLDLVICGDWMPVTILENDGQGALEYLSEEAGAPDLTGLWTTLAIADVNKDGQLDIFAGNLGTNSLMQASKENPVQLYLGDFDENGFVDPLVFFRYFDRYIPLGSKDKLLSQLPGLKKDFVAYAKYAEVAGFDGLLPSGRPLIVEEKSAESMASNLFLSRPDGGYDALPLQGAIQWGTVQDMWFDESSEQLYYITSNAELSAVHGSSQSARGGTIGSFDPENQEFKSLEQIELPRGVQARALVPVAQNQLLLVTNNNYPYLLEQR